MKGTQLSEYVKTTLNRGAAAVLPQHLDPLWLGLLLEEVEDFRAGEGDCASLLASVLTILSYQQRDAWDREGELEVETDRLFQCLDYYGLCLAMEEVSRKTDIRGEPPTLENIFDEQRVVTFSRKGQ